MRVSRLSDWWERRSLAANQHLHCLLDQENKFLQSVQSRSVPCDGNLILTHCKKGQLGVHTFNPSAQEAEAGGCLSSRSQTPSQR